MPWLKFCICGLIGMLVAIGMTALFALAAQWMPFAAWNRSSISSDAFLLCCGLLITGWVLICFAYQAISTHAKEVRLQSAFQVRPYLTSAFDCSVEHATHDSNSFFVQVYGSLVSAAASPDSFHGEGFAREMPPQPGMPDSYTASEGKCLVAYRLKNICMGAAVHFSVTINNQRLFQFQSLGANAQLTIYLSFDQFMLLANECLLSITLRYQDTFSLSEYTQKETATVMQSFGQCPTVVGRMEDILTPPTRCPLTPIDPDCPSVSRKRKRKG